MVKNLQDYLKTGRDPAYLKNGDTWISQGMQAEITAAAKMGIEPQFIYIGKEKR